MRAKLTLLGATKHRDTPIRVEVGGEHIVDGKPEAAYALLQHMIGTKAWEQAETIRHRELADGELERKDRVMGADRKLDEGASRAKRRHRFLKQVPAACALAKARHELALAAVARHIDSLPKPKRTFEPINPARRVRV